MSPRLKIYFVFFIAIAVILAILSFIPPSDEMKQRMNQFGERSGTTEIPPATNNPGFETYKDDTYKFSLSYPVGITLEFSFKQYYHLTSNWRAEAFLTGNSTGTPVIALPLVRIENTSTYPRYFAAEVRVGVSSNGEDVVNCLIAGNGEVDLGTAMINGVEFRKFEMHDAGMMQYMEGTSYRTVENGMCYAVEQLKTGSSYRDEPNAADTSDEVLNSYYDRLSDIINTFTFTN